MLQHLLVPLFHKQESCEVQFLKQQRVQLKQRQREQESILAAYAEEDGGQSDSSLMILEFLVGR